MIDAVSRSFNYQLDNLAQHLGANYHRESPESGFAHYVFHQTNSQIPFDIANDVDIATLDSNRLNQAPALAAIGYGLACGRQFSTNFLEIWANGLNRLSGREAFPSDRTSFFYRSTELLGIALGISHHYKNQPEQSKWLQDILIKGEPRLLLSDIWTFLLSAYAAHILSIDWKSRGLPLVHQMTVDELALAKWFCSIEPTFASKFGLIQLEPSIDKALLEYWIEFSSSTHGSPRTAILYFAIKKTITHIIQSSWDDSEQIRCNPQKAVEWLNFICDRIHTVTQHFQSQLAKESNPEALKVHTMQMLLQALSQLRSDTNIIEAEISEQIKMHSSLYIGNNQGTVIAGSNITMTHNQESVTNKTTINASNATIGFINSGSGTVSDFSQNIGQNIDEISRLITSLREMAKQFPATQREEALVYLDDLQEDISTPEKQKPERIKIRLGRLLVIAGTIAGIVAGAADFSNNVLELSQKLNVPIELNHPHLIQQIPPSTP
ncbi:MAG: hypothetical protein V7L21_28020 [Nostoc sp.]|uniref:hypothetical protein n=1 Tax=Nostoc sp. TaxID=1180 RepID=UPI002FF4D094